VCVLVNPRAGSAAQLAAFREALAASRKVTVREVRPGHDLGAMARDAAAGRFDVVAVAGGDGTVHAAVNGLAPDFPRTLLAVFPLGTGNDLCRTLAIPLEPGAAVDLLRTGRRRAVDLIRVEAAGTTAYCVNAATGGFSGQVTAGLTKDVKAAWGPLAYLRGAVGPMAEATVYDVTLWFDYGPAEELAVHNVVVANGRTSGGGLMIAPLANPEDGLMDVVLIRAGGVLDMSVVAARLMAGDYQDDEFVELRRCRHLELASETPMPFSIDGDVTEGRSFRFTAVPRAVRVLAGLEYRADPATAEPDEPEGSLGAPGAHTFRQRVFAFLAALFLLAFRWARVYAAGLGVAVVAAGLFGLLAREVNAGRWTDWNESAYWSLRARASPGLDTFARALTLFGGVVESIALGALLVMALAARKRYLDAATLFAVLAGCGVLEVVLKALFAVPRPDLAPPLAAAEGFSFPSGHALRAVGLYGTLAALVIGHNPRAAWRWLCGVALGLLAAGVCWTRLYLGVHWLSDVAAGSLAAVVWVSGCLIVRASVRSRVREPRVASRAS
jgi:diacylglycerol kinase (ATP)